MRSILGFAAVLIFAVLTVGCQDSRVPALEQRIGHLEQTVQQLQSERDKSANDRADKIAKLERCVTDANAEFKLNIESNGTKNRDGTGYSVPVPILTEMQRQKQSQIEECRLLYSPR
jgi:hypothetical protein